MESTSSVTLTEEEDFLEGRRRQNRSSSPRVSPPRPQVDLPPYQERDPYPITGYSNIPVGVPMEGMVLPTQYL